MKKAKKQNTEQKIEAVRDLLNQIIVTAGKSKDEFLGDAVAYAKALLAPPLEPVEFEFEDMEADDDYEDNYDDSMR